MQQLADFSPAEIRAARYRPLPAVAVAMCAGILLDRLVFSHAMPYGLPLWSAGAILLLAGYALLARMEHNAPALLLLLAAVACTGGLWHHLRWNYFPHDDLSRFATDENQPVCVEATALAGPTLRPAPSANPLRVIPPDPTSETVVEIERVRDGTTWRPAGGRCQLRVAGRWTDVEAGDRLLIFAKLGRQPPPMNPGQFDWQRHQRATRMGCGLYCTSSECVRLLQPRTEWPLQRGLDRFREYCLRWLAHYVGPDEGGLAATVLLGEREILSYETTKAYFETGMIHMLVVSGLHVGIIAATVWWFAQLGLLSHRKVILLTIAVVVIYAAVVGGRPPVVRASAIAILGLLSMLVGRRASSLNILSAAAIVVLAINPAELFRGGTQLSFVSVGAIIAYSQWVSRHKNLDPLQRLLWQATPWPQKILRTALRWFGHLMAASVVVLVVVAPLVAYHFNILTPIGVVISPLVWPLILAALSAGLATLTIGWLLPPLAVVSGKICAVSLHLLHQTVQWAHGIDFGHAYTPSPPLWWICLFYAGIAFFLLRPRLVHLSFLNLPRRRTALAAVWIALGMWLTTTHTTPQDQLRATFLAVGHGTCVVMELPGGQTVLYDAGSMRSPESTSRTIASFLWSRHITHLDAVVLSHPDVDHYNAVPGLIERFDVGAVYVSPMMFDALATDGQLRAPNYLRSFITGHGVPLREVWMNDRLRTADSRVQIEVLHPPREGVIGRDNANSILLSVNFAGWRILLPGDIEAPGLPMVIADPPHDCDILLAPHHGSTHSDPPGFAAWCRPEWVVVSGDHRDAVLTTTKSYQDQGAEVIHTANQGAVQFVLSEDALRASHHLVKSE